MSAPTIEPSDARVVVRDVDLTIYVGDSFDLVKSLDDESVDAIVTSPPYGDARDDDYPCAKPDEYADWIAPLLGELYRVLKPQGGFMLNLGRIFRGGVEHPYIDETLARARTVGWLRIDTLIWHKPNARGNQHERLRDQHEYVFWLAKQPDAYRGFDSDTRSPYAPSSLARYERPFKSAAKGRPRAEAGRIPNPDGTKPGSVFSATVGHEKGVLHPAPMAVKDRQEDRRERRDAAQPLCWIRSSAAAPRRSRVVSADGRASGSRRWICTRPRPRAGWPSRRS